MILPEIQAVQVLLKAPFPYFGGKPAVAPEGWRAIGDVLHYMEPFAGSAAVLLRRPGYDPTRHMETINDLDGLICNVWRALRAAPDEVAKWCDQPVSHIDLMARKKALNESYAGLVEKLCADDSYYDPKLAGYYVWAASCWIGHGLVRPGQIPHLSDGGMGVHAKGQIPHLADAGMGVQEPCNTNIYAWFRCLAERLRYVRTICGDWRRCCGGNWQTNPGRPCGVFMDPPYGAAAQRDPGCYNEDSLQVAAEVRQWCLDRGSDKDYRIVLAGYYEEHESLLAEGWSVHRWSANGGYGNLGRSEEPTAGQLNRHREALFLSPYCLPLESRAGQLALFETTQDQGVSI